MSNPTKSNFQTANPLSPRKFWKKVIEKIISMGLVSILVSIVPIVFIGISQNNSSDTSSFLVASLATVIGIYILLMASYAIYVKYYIKYYFYDGGVDFITIKKGVFAPTEIHVQYQKIQDVYVDQDILDRVMGLYDVHIASATVSSGIEAHIDGVDKETAERLKNFFLQMIKEKVGGYQATSSQPAGGSVGQGSVTPSTLILNEVISSDTYPISGRWVFARIIGNMTLGTFYTLIITFYAFTPGKNGSVSLATDFGWSGASLMWFVPLMVLIFATLHTVYNLFWKSTFSFNFLPEYISLRTGVIARQEKHVPYNTVQDVSIAQGIIDRLLGIATVRVENAAGAQMGVFSGVGLPGQPIERAQRISQILKEGVLSRNTQQSTGL